MNKATVTHIRELLCRAMSDIGGTCERLREFDDADMSSEMASESRDEIANWLNQAADTINEAATVAMMGEVEE